MPGREGSSDSYRYGFNGMPKDDEVKGEGNSLDFGARIYDSRVARWLSVDSWDYKYAWQTPYAYYANSPIAQIDYLGKGADDPVTHEVKKGETLSGISDLYGVTVEDLAKMNNIEDIHKIQIGQVLSVNPEVDFSNNPKGGYQNPNNSEGTQVSPNYLVEIGLNFGLGTGEENPLIVGGGALKSVQNWTPVKTGVNQGFQSIKEDGRISPGEVYSYSYSPGNILDWAKRAWQGKEDVVSPVHVIGSFNMTVRVNADGNSVTITVYDSKTLESGLDNRLEDIGRPRTEDDRYRNLGTNTFQRYIWEQPIEL